MGVTAHHLATRQRYLGGTDVAALFGLDPRKTAWDVWAFKTGCVETRAREESPMQAGKVFESGVIDWAQGELGPVIKNQVRVAHDCDAPLRAQIDAIVRDSGEPVEAKTAGLFGPLNPAWGEPGTDQIPDHYLIQVHVQMIVTGAEIAHVPAFLGGRGFQMYHVQRSQRLAGEIVERAARFWQDHVLPGIPPSDVVPSLDVVSRLRREPGKLVAVNASRIARYMESQKARLDAEKAEETAKAALLAELGDAEGSLPEAGFQVLYLSQNVQRLDGKVLAEKHPEIAKEYMRASTYRVLRIKKVKGGA